MHRLQVRSKQPEFVHRNINNGCKHAADAHLGVLHEFSSSHAKYFSVKYKYFWTSQVLFLPRIPEIAAG